MLKRLGAKTLYIDAHVKVGVLLLEGGRCAIVDTGLDDDAGKQVLKVLQAEGLTVSRVILTHHHADHIGAAALIRRRTGAQVMASHFEKALVENPYLEPFYLYGAAPFDALENRFLKAKPCPVDLLLEEGPLVIGGEAVGRVVALPGHSHQQMGFCSPDDVLFTADAFFPAEVLDKYPIPYYADVTQARATLETLLATGHAAYLPAHGEPVGDVKPVARMNLEVMDRLSEFILETLARRPRSREEVLAAVVEAFPVTLNSTQFHLTYSAIGAYLAHLKHQKLIEPEFTSTRMLWRRSG